MSSGPTDIATSTTPTTTLSASTSRQKLHARVAPNIALQVTANAAKYGVTVSTYVAEVLRQHVAGDELSFAARATGLAAAGEDTRSLVAKAGVAGRERKSTARKLAAPRRRK